MNMHIMPGNGRASVIVANEPLSYREVIAVAFERLRPEANVVCIAPEALESALERHKPVMVICSALPLSEHSLPPFWALLYPDGQPRAVVMENGKKMTFEDVEFSVLLSLLDGALLLARS